MSVVNFSKLVEELNIQCHWPLKTAISYSLQMCHKVQLYFSPCCSLLIYLFMLILYSKHQRTKMWRMNCITLYTFTFHRSSICPKTVAYETSHKYIRWHIWGTVGLSQNNNYSTNIHTDIYWSLDSHTVVRNELWQEWHDYKCVCCIREFIRGPQWGEAAWCCCAGWLSWLAAGLATVLDMAGRDCAVGCIWAAGCCVSR
jgi:hypothetical protein